jgi:hypothetical protein
VEVTLEERLPIGAGAGGQTGDTGRRRSRKFQKAAPAHPRLIFFSTHAQIRLFHPSA